MDRAMMLADAAVAVVGRRGLRALTHRAVDEEAGLPTGSTSNIYRSRSALVGAVLGRLLERETSIWLAAVLETHQAAAPPPEQRAADLLLRMLEVLTTAERDSAMARLALFGETAWDPGVRATLLDARASVHQSSRDVLARAGLHVDEAGIVVILGTFDHLLSTRLLGGEASDLERQVLQAALRTASHDRHRPTTSTPAKPA